MNRDYTDRDVVVDRDQDYVCRRLSKTPQGGFHLPVSTRVAQLPDQFSNTWMCDA